MLVCAALGLGGALAFQSSPVHADRLHDEGGRHVLLISVDGLHASDLSRWIAAHPQSNLANLSKAGTTYANASASEPSDSFPGLMALVTGGTPKTTGVFYDDTFTRNMWAPGSNCPGPAGTETMYAENLDKTDASGNIPLFTSIDPSQLPLGMVHGKCVPVYPHSFLQVNTIFNVAHDDGLYTAWSDKHPAYEIVRGPENTGAEDLFTPEINNVNDPTAISVAATEQYDTLKVQAVLNEIDGKTSTGSPAPAVPAIFGMNFQSVSVAEKLVDSYATPGGYQPGTLAFTPQMSNALGFVDDSLGKLAHQLQLRHLTQSTEIIITAKHGQSPIDPSKLQKVGHAVTTVLTNAGIGVAQVTDDDVALVWLQDQSKTADAVTALMTDKHGANSARIDYVLSGDALADRFGDPRHNSRTPDLIVQPVAGTIYTTSKAKVAEHGGFAPDDTHVALLVVNGSGEQNDGQQDGDHGDHGSVVTSSVHTTQVAPTILQFLGVDPNRLQAVRREGTQPLPR
jgi:hypothetical protein